jgi:hypothetical protein
MTYATLTDARDERATRDSSDSFGIASWLRQQGRALAALQNARAEARWRRDPLSHPALKHMSARDLADLPLDRALFGDAGR